MSEVCPVTQAAEGSKKTWPVFPYMLYKTVNPGSETETECHNYVELHVRRSTERV